MKVQPTDWTRIVPHLVPKAEVFEFIPFGKDEEEENTSSYIAPKAPSRFDEKRLISSVEDIDSEVCLLLDGIREKESTILLFLDIPSGLINQTI